MAIASVLDTNTVIYFLGNRLADKLPAGRLYVSVISEIELLSYPEMTPAEEESIKNFLMSIEILGIDDQTKTEAIRIRRTHRLKISDAIIAASALSLGAQLVTSDAQLKGIEGLSVVAMPFA